MLLWPIEIHRVAPITDNHCEKKKKPKKYHPKIEEQNNGDAKLLLTWVFSKMLIVRNHLFCHNIEHDDDKLHLVHYICLHIKQIKLNKRLQITKLDIINFDETQTYCLMVK